jgi:hypothetical protein
MSDPGIARQTGEGDDRSGEQHGGRKREMTDPATGVASSTAMSDSRIGHWNYPHKKQGCLYKLT